MLSYVTVRRAEGGFLGGTWAGMGYIRRMFTLHDYLQLALMLRHPVHIPHTAQGPVPISNSGSAGPFDKCKYLKTSFACFVWFAASTPPTEPQCFRQLRCALHSIRSEHIILICHLSDATRHPASLQMRPTKHMMSFFSGKGQAAAMTSQSLMKEGPKAHFHPDCAPLFPHTSGTLETLPIDSHTTAPHHTHSPPPPDHRH